MSSSNISGITGSLDPGMTTTHEIAISGFSCGARVDTEANESLDEDEEDDILDGTPSIEQISTWSSSNPSAGGEGSPTFWVEARADNEALATFSCVKEVYNTTPGTTTRVAHGGSLIGGTKALDAQAG
jgi:hypothetical protein